MGQNNALPGLFELDLEALKDSVGVTRFSQSDEASWYQTIGGLLFQGGKITTVAGSPSASVVFLAPFPKQTLGIFLTPIRNATASWAIDSPTLEGCDVYSSVIGIEYYWVAVGL